MQKAHLIHPRQDIFYFILPYKRNQDAISFSNKSADTSSTICVVDGWQNTDYFPGDMEGRQAAELVVKMFPKTFLTSPIKDVHMRAQLTADEVNIQLLKQFPEHVSCVGTFIFRHPDQTIIATIGTITTLTLKNNVWEQPDKIRNNELDWEKYESSSTTFLGRGELENNPLYSHRMDTVICPPSVPILVLTDGARQILDTSTINAFLKKGGSTPNKAFVEDLLTHVLLNENEQNDDISVLLTTPV